MPPPVMELCDAIGRYRRCSLGEIARLLRLSARTNQPTVLVNAWQTDGALLVEAIKKGRVDILELLLDRGADINAVGGTFGTALATAALLGEEEVVSLLVDRGADINAVGGTHGTALATAAFSGEKGVVSQLLGLGADINSVCGAYGSALASATYEGNKEIILLLLGRGADINMVGGTYGTALATAAASGNQEIMQLLLDQGADINLVASEYGTSLGQAVYQNSGGIVLFLLAYGADAMRVGGSYPTTSGVYPSALDAARSNGSRADATLLALLENAVGEWTGPGIKQANPNIDPADDVISRAPFPMPYAGPYAAEHYQDKSPSSLFDILPSAKLRADSNITPEQADIPCRGLNEEDLCHSLAALVGLHKDTIQTKCQWIRNDIRYFFSCNFDFGLAYAAARVAWKDFNESSMDSNVISIQRGRWHKQAQLLLEARSKAISIETNHSGSGQELIISPYSVMPRRLWDLKSNRVVDFRMLHAAQSIGTMPTFWAVSHSWTNDMHPVSTTINQHQWPIPLPKGISLDYLRCELLSLGAEYIWLDVACLRQHSEVSSHDQIKQMEWKLDVPTIGNIYRTAAKIVRYFNGLGVRFSKNGWDDQRHWLQRAWTLQEIATENTTFNGGIPRDKGRVILNSRGRVSGKVITLRNAIRPVIQLAAQVDTPGGCGVYELVREMTRRHASKPVDKLSGLFYLLRTTKLPCYDEKMTSDDFWTQCFHLLPAERKIEVLFDFPYRGSEEQWFPTWAQIMDWPTRDPQFEHARPAPSSPGLVGNIPEETPLLIRNIWAAPNVVLHESDNPGEYEVKVSNQLFGFYMPYLLQKPIDTRGPLVFTLATVNLGHSYNWVVCRAIEKRVTADVNVNREVAKVKVLKKVGVFRTDSCSELLVLLQKMDCLFV